MLIVHRSWAPLRLVDGRDGAALPRVVGERHSFRHRELSRVGRPRGLRPRDSHRYRGEGERLRDHGRTRMRQHLPVRRCRRRDVVAELEGRRRRSRTRSGTSSSTKGQPGILVRQAVAAAIGAGEGHGPEGGLLLPVGGECRGPRPDQALHRFRGGCALRGESGVASADEDRRRNFGRSSSRASGAARPSMPQVEWFQSPAGRDRPELTASSLSRALTTGPVAGGPPGFPTASEVRCPPAGIDHASSGHPYEATIGFSRAIPGGQTKEVAGGIVAIWSGRWKRADAHAQAPSGWESVAARAAPPPIWPGMSFDRRPSPTPTPPINV